MVAQDTSGLKERIINFVRIRGPSLPVHIAKEIGLSILFTSAFLSELLSEKRIKISHMKIGSSSLHFIEGQEPKLENFSQHLGRKEKEAFQLIKEKKFLYDNAQEPAIRVALRAINDFAIPFQENNQLIWRFFITPEEDFKPKEPPKVEKVIEETQPKEPQEKITKEIEIPVKEKSKILPKEELDIFDKKSKKKKKKTSTKKDDKFFNKVKEFLSQKSIEMVDIEGFNKNELTLKVKKNGKEELLIAYNKKKITDADIIKANKKASEMNLQYTLTSLGELPKKMANFIDAIKNLSDIEKIE